MKDQLQQINLNTSPEKMLEMIAHEREKKDGQDNTLKIINKAIDVMHDFIVNLYFERAHIYQLMYMTERDKLDKGDVGKNRQSLRKMEKFINETRKYIDSNGLKRWLHRLYRFYGKLNEYKGNYKAAVEYYKKSLKYLRTDPEYVEKGVPRGLELEGFLSSAMIMNGDIEKGLRKAKAVYKKYESTKLGRQLKNKDYTTWAIWRTGCVIYAARGLVKGKLAEIDKKEILDWLNEAEKYLYPPKTVKVWADFQFRKDEIKALKKLIIA